MKGEIKGKRCCMRVDIEDGMQGGRNMMKTNKLREEFE